MSRTTLILLAVLILAIAGGGVFYWFNQDKVANILNTGAANTNAVTNTAVTNTPLLTGTAPQLIEGDKKLTGSFTVNQVKVDFTGVTRTSTFEAIEAGQGQDFVVVYFQSVAPTEVLSVKRGLEANTSLTSGTNSYKLAGLKIASTLITNDRGYMKFVVSESITNLQLEIGSGETVQETVLP